MGSRDPYEYWGRWHSFGKTYLICIIAQAIENCFSTLLLAICVRGRWWVAAESGDLWSGAHTQPSTIRTTNTSAFNDTSRHDVDKNWIPQVMLGFSSSFPINYTCYQFTAVGKYCTLCGQMLYGANWHEAPWKLGLFTFILWSGHCIQLALTSTAMIQIYISGARLMSFEK